MPSPPGWYYIGHGTLRYRDENGWTDQYQSADGPTKSNQDPVKVVYTAPTTALARGRRRSLVPLLAAALLAIAGAGAAVTTHNLTLASDTSSSTKAVQARVPAPATLAAPKTRPRSTAAKPHPASAPAARPSRTPIPPSTTATRPPAPPPTVVPPSPALAKPAATPVTAPTSHQTFDAAYARRQTTNIVTDVATADERFLDRPEIGATTTMDFLAQDMDRLLNAGMPPVADKAHYYALVTTLGQFYTKAAGQLPDDVMGAAATYTVTRQQTTELLNILNPVLGTHHALPTWSFM